MNFINASDGDREKFVIQLGNFKNGRLHKERLEQLVALVILNKIKKQDHVNVQLASQHDAFKLTIKS